MACFCQSLYLSQERFLAKCVKATQIKLCVSNLYGLVINIMQFWPDPKHKATQAKVVRPKPSVGSNETKQALRHLQRYISFHDQAGVVHLIDGFLKAVARQGQDLQNAILGCPAPRVLLWTYNETGYISLRLAWHQVGNCLTLMSAPPKKDLEVTRFVPCGHLRIIHFPAQGCLCKIWSLRNAEPQKCFKHISGEGSSRWHFRKHLT